MANRTVFEDVVDGDTLFEGYFNGIQPEIDTVSSDVTFDYDNTGASTTSSSYQDVLDVTSAVTNFDNQKVLVEADWSGFETSSTGDVRVYDVTNTAALATVNLTSNRDRYNYIGTVTIASAGNSLNVKIQYKSDGVNTTSMLSSRLKLTLIPN